jgi:cardiolipin synthase
MIEGNVINQLQTIFLYDWYLETKKIAMKKEYYPNLKADNSKKTRLQTVYSGPETEWETIKQTYFMMITNAKKNVWIYTPYFIPDESLSMALKNAALAGVDVKIIVPSRPDHIVPFHASRTYFGELLKAGAKIYEYLPGFIHSKAVMIDGIIANAGTANFDIRSFNVNFDVNLIFYDDDIVNKIEADFQKSLKQSKEITYEEFTKRKISTKFKQSLARLFSPIL